MTYVDDGTVMIRTAVEDDIPAMVELERQCATAAHWRDDDYSRIFTQDVPMRCALVIEEVGMLQGFVVTVHIADEWEIENIAVNERQRRRGLGRALLQEFFKLARARGSRTVFLEVRASNGAARALYEKSGFDQVGVRKAYYSEPTEDAVIYQKSL